MKKRVAVIGGGVAGLSTAVYLAHSGLDVDVYEACHMAGGVCVGWKRRGLLCDGCIHWTQGGASLHRYIEVGAVRKPSDIVSVADAPSVFFDEASGRRLSVGGDLAQLQRDMDALSPADTQRTAQFIAMCDAFRRVGDFDLPAKPLDMQWFYEKIAFGMRSLGFVRAMRASSGAESTLPLEEYCAAFQDRFVGQCIAHTFTGCSVQFAAYAIGMRPLMFRPRGGSAAFSENIARRVVELGGRIHLNARVAEIVVDAAGRAAGVKLCGSDQVHPADVVVAACDLHETVEKLLGGTHEDPKASAFLRDLKPFDPLCMVSLCLDVEPDASVPENFSVFLQHPLMSPACPRLASVYFHTFRHGTHPEHVPTPGKSVVQVMYMTDFDLWDGFMKESRGRYDAAKRSLAEEAFSLARKFVVPQAPESALLHADVSTPLTWVRYTSNFRGSFEGFQFPANTSMADLPSLTNHSRVSGLFFAGQWANPGGGILPCIVSGSHTAQRVCSHLGTPFSCPSSQFDQSQL